MEKGYAIAVGFGKNVRNLGYTRERKVASTTKKKQTFRVLLKNVR